MKWLKRRLRNWLSEHEQEVSEVYATTTKARAIVSRSDVDSEDGLNITVRQAQGGKVITFRHYDRKTDRNNHKLYVIPDDLDFERELGKMITLESMRG